MVIRDELPDNPTQQGENPMSDEHQMPTGPAPIEPSADLRQAAHDLREMFLALTAEGFTVTEAIAIIGQVIAAGRAS